MERRPSLASDAVIFGVNFAGPHILLVNVRDRAYLSRIAMILSSTARLEELDTFLAFTTEDLCLAALDKDIQRLEHGVVVHPMEF